MSGVLATGVDIIRTALSVTVETLETVIGSVFVSWDEAVEQVVEVAPGPLGALGAAGCHKVFRFAGGEEVTEIRSRDGAVVGRVVRRRGPTMRPGRSNGARQARL